MSGTRCFKCLDDIAIVGTREGANKAYCRTCFLDNYHKNVRDAFFRQCRIPPNVPIILAVSGGMNSMAMMHSLGLLRVQNITRGGAGKINFNMHVLHLSGDDYNSNAVEANRNEGVANNNNTMNTKNNDRKLHCANSIFKACTAIAPIDHVPQATTTKRRVQEKKQQQQGTAVNADGTATNLSGKKVKPQPPVEPTPLFEASRVHIRKLSNYLPSYDSLSSTFFGTTPVSSSESIPSTHNDNNKNIDDSIRPLTSVAMAEDLLAHLRLKAIATAAAEIAQQIIGNEASNGNALAAATSSSSNSKGAPHPPPFYLLLGDGAVKSSVEALYQLTRGRGQSILDHCGSRGSLFGGLVAVRRPMRSLLPKENLFYCRIEGLENFWTPVPVPSATCSSFLMLDSKNAADNHDKLRAVSELLQFCIATTFVHKDLSHLLIAMIKKKYAGTPLAVISHKQRNSTKTLLEHFVLNLTDGSYRSAIFNIIHSIDKMMNENETASSHHSSSTSSQSVPSTTNTNGYFDGTKTQPRFGPKNAAVYATSSSAAAGEHSASSDPSSSPVSSKAVLLAPHCALCGGRCDKNNNSASSLDTNRPQPSSLSWSWCRSCRQVLRPIFDSAAASDTSADATEKEKNELMSFLTATAISSSSSVKPLETIKSTDECCTEEKNENIIRLTRAQIRSEIAEFLLDNDDDQ